MNRKTTRKLALRRLTIGKLEHVRGGITRYVSYDANCSFSCTTCEEHSGCNATIGRCPINTQPDRTC